MPKVKRCRQRLSKLHFNVAKRSSIENEPEVGPVDCPNSDEDSEAVVDIDESSSDGDSTASSGDSTVSSEDDVLFRQPNWNLGECVIVKPKRNHS